MGLNFAVVDLGASDTRVSGKDNVIHEVPNNLRKIGLEENLKLEPWIQPLFKDTLLSSLDVTIKRLDEATEYVDKEARYVWGSYATRLGSTEKPNSSNKKHEQPINYANMLMAIGVELLLSPTSFEREVDGTAVLQLFMDLPPIECRGKEEIFAQNIIGTYQLTFNALVPARTVKFKINGVCCIAEALATLYSYFFDINSNPIPEHIKEKDKGILCLDIGASTIDLAAMIGGRFIEKSGDTCPIGGNQIRDALMYYLQSEYNYTPSIQVAEEAVQTGFVEIGSSNVDVTACIIEAKEDFAVDVITHLMGYFKRVRFSLASFSKLIVAGGGSLPSTIKKNDVPVETTPPLSNYLTERLQQSCKTLLVENISGNPRHANVKGLLVQARIWLKRNGGR